MHVYDVVALCVHCFTVHIRISILTCADACLSFYYVLRTAYTVHITCDLWKKKITYFFAFTLFVSLDVAIWFGWYIKIVICWMHNGHCTRMGLHSPRIVLKTYIRSQSLCLRSYSIVKFCRLAVICLFVSHVVATTSKLTWNKKKKNQRQASFYLTTVHWLRQWQNVLCRDSLRTKKIMTFARIWRYNEKTSHWRTESWQFHHSNEEEEEKKK